MSCIACGAWSRGWLGSRPTVTVPQSPRSEWDSRSLAPLAGVTTSGQQGCRQVCQLPGEGPAGGSVSVVHLLGLKAGLRPWPHLSPPSKGIIKGWYFFFLVKFQQKVYASLNMEIQNFISNLLDLN